MGFISLSGAVYSVLAADVLVIIHGSTGTGLYLGKKPNYPLMLLKLLY